MKAVFFSFHDYHKACSRGCSAVRVEHFRISMFRVFVYAHTYAHEGASGVNELVQQPEKRKKERRAEDRQVFLLRPAPRYRSQSTDCVQLLLLLYVIFFPFTDLSCTMKSVCDIRQTVIFWMLLKNRTAIFRKWTGSNCYLT